MRKLKQKSFLFVLSLLLCISSFGLSYYFKRPYAILKAREGAGLFSTMTDVAALLHAYETKAISGFEINFGPEGVYYDAKEAANWWLFFCEPLQRGSSSKIKRGSYGQIPGVPPYEFFSTRDEVFYLIEKYIRFKPFITSKVEEFCEDHFQNGPVLAIHYRGTDWFSGNGFGRISYASFSEKAEEFIQENGDYKIFIATDEKPFLDYMLEKFGTRVCCQTEAYRSLGEIPIHMDPNISPRRSAEEAMIDCLLLSKADVLIGTRSNMSRWASFFNPKMTYIDLSQEP